MWRWFLRTKRRAGPFYPVPARFGPLGRRAAQLQPAAVIGARVALSLLAVGHLALAGFFPEGRNPLLGMETRSVFSYLKNFPIGDTLGFYKTRGLDGFIVYKIYTQDGRVVEGAFPDQEVSPRLRYDRWALLTHHLGADNPQSHGVFVKYLVERLPSAPVKVELLSAKWDWSRGNGNPGNNPEKHGGLLVLQNLGTYDGLRKKWNPAGQDEKK